MVELEINDNDNTVSVHVLGSHRLLALRQQASFDRDAVVSIVPAEVDLRPPWVRAPGTFLPGVIAAGVFRGKGRREFWDTKFGGNAVQIDLAPGGDFTRLVVDVDNVDAVIRELAPHSAAA
ncbi:hypothetical protein [Nocardia camponoti]|uniref:Uncharacterized protein n=1 Tax=Nocardia camponoti TaxID=1616106 RepID=A0A917VER3_9NOCA|nr:hypothetical protein [Nocardia camponoti]GGK67107.1 hypothetical protein GCM10011591_44050 [Nocardia camponoti]